MIRTFRRTAVLSALALLAVAVACGSDNTGAGTEPGGGTTPTSPTSGITIDLDTLTDGQTAAAGTPITITIYLKNSDSSAAANQTVTWQALLGDGTVSPETSVSAPDGSASTQWTLGKTAEFQTLSASITGASVTFGATAIAGPATLLAKVSADSQTVVPGGSVQFVVQVTDQYGNGVTGDTVTWSASGGLLTPAADTAGANGDVATTLTTDLAPATYTVTAAVAGLPPVTFTLTATNSVADTTQSRARRPAGVGAIDNRRPAGGP